MSFKTAKKLVVCGGNGFLGSRICQHAVSRGWDVVSVSRSGDPNWSSLTSSPTPPAWAHRVAWERADLLRPSTYAPFILNADCVVHSLGILFEADYKGVVAGSESPVSFLRRAFANPFTTARPPPQASSTYPPPISPNDDPEADLSQPPGNDGKPTYELMNRDTALALARIAHRDGVPAMAYISAAAGAPILPPRYISTKREAEGLITRDYPKLRGVFIRPPLMYDSARPVTLAAAASAVVGATANTLTGGVFSNFLGAAGMWAAKVDTVAQATVEALDDESIRGPVEAERLGDLARQSWRKTML